VVLYELLEILQTFSITYCFPSFFFFPFLLLFIFILGVLLCYLILFVCLFVFFWPFYTVFYCSTPVSTMLYPIFFFFFSAGCPGTHFVDQAGLELRNPPASASRVLGLKASATTPDFYPLSWESLWVKRINVR
jgi:hypothetical protein